MFASHFDLVWSCSIYLHICKMNGYLARFLQEKGLSCKILQDFGRKSCKTMYRHARFCQNLARSCKITIRCRLGYIVSLVFCKLLLKSTLSALFRCTCVFCAADVTKLENLSSHDIFQFSLLRTFNFALKWRYKSVLILGVDETLAHVLSCFNVTLPFSTQLSVLKDVVRLYPSMKEILSSWQLALVYPE